MQYNNKNRLKRRNYVIQGGPTKVVPTVTSENVSWYHFSWATLYISFGSKVVVTRFNRRKERVSTMTWIAVIS